MLRQVADRSTDRQTDSQVDSQTNSHTDSRSNRQTNRQNTTNELLRFNHSSYHIFGDWTFSPTRNQERVLFRHEMLVGICTCRPGLHRGKPSGREQRSKPHSWSRGVLLPLEHLGDFRAEGESQERLVSDESEEEIRVLGKAWAKS